MDEIASGDSSVWHSNRGAGSRTPRRRARAPQKPQPDVAELAIEPMQPRARKRLPTRGEWRYERLPGGRRVMAYVTPETATLVDEHGRARSGPWPEIVESLQSLARRAKASFVLDGEVVEDTQGVRFEVYDLLLLGDAALLGEPWSERRAALESLVRRRNVDAVRLVEISDDGDAVRTRARQEGWPGFRARALDGTYSPGATSTDWLEFA